MKALFITPDLPYPPHNGGKIRDLNLLKAAAARHEVTLLSFDRSPEQSGRAAALQDICERVVVVPLDRRQRLDTKRTMQLRSLAGRHPYSRYRSHSLQMQEAIDRLAAKAFDLIQVESSPMACYRLPAGTPAVLDEHNVEFDLLRRMYENEPVSVRKLYAYVEWQKFERDERRAWQQFPLCLATSQRDRDLIEMHQPGTRAEVIPNGVDVDHYTPGPPPHGEPNTLLFTGTIDYFPNTDGLGHFFDDILPLVRREVPDVEFIVAGRNPPPSVVARGLDERVTITGAVEDMRPYYERASVVVVPLRVGGGTRLKILEALSMGKATVSTSVGAEGIALAAGRDLILADDPVLFARAVIDLLADEQARARLGAQGSATVRANYSWDAIGAMMLDLHDELIQANSAR